MVCIVDCMLSEGEKEEKQIMINYSHCYATRDSWEISVTFLNPSQQPQQV